MSFVERALPLPTSSISSSHSYSRNGGRVLETPPDRPVWETRQPLKGVSHEGRYPSYDTSMDQEQHNILGITMTISIRFLPQGGYSGFQLPTVQHADYGKRVRGLLLLEIHECKVTCKVACM